MSALSLQRQENVSELLCNIRNVIYKQTVSLPALERVKEILLSLASQEHLFSEPDYPTPRPDEYAKVYLLRDDWDGAFSLNLVSSLPLGPSPIHDHGHLGVIAGLAADDENTVYKRLDDGSRLARQL